MAKVVLENIGKSFGTVDAVKDFNLVIEDKEFCILVGPSEHPGISMPRTVEFLVIFIFENLASIQHFVS